MRKPHFHELGSIMFAAYIWFTLTIDPNFFAKAIEADPSSMYQGYINMLGSQENLAMLSLGVATVIFVTLFISNYNTRIFAIIISILYLTLIAASYLFNYPNLGLGLIAILVGRQIYEANSLIDESEEYKKQKIIKDNYKNGDKEKDEIKENNEELHE